MLYISVPWELRFVEKLGYDVLGAIINALKFVGTFNNLVPEKKKKTDLNNICGSLYEFRPYLYIKDFLDLRNVVTSFFVHKALEKHKIWYIDGALGQDFRD